MDFRPCLESVFFVCVWSKCDLHAVSMGGKSLHQLFKSSLCQCYGSEEMFITEAFVMLQKGFVNSLKFARSGRFLLAGTGQVNFQILCFQQPSTFAPAMIMYMYSSLPSKRS